MATGIQERTDKKGKQRYRGSVWNKARGKTDLGPWGSRVEARAWRTKALGEVASGQRSSTDTTTLREAWEEFTAGARSGAITDRTGKPYKPSTLRGGERG